MSGFTEVKKQGGTAHVPKTLWPQAHIGAFVPGRIACKRLGHFYCGKSSALDAYKGHLYYGGNHS